MQEDVLFQITNGLYVISARHKDKPEICAGAVVDALSQVGIKPNLLMLSCMNSGYTKECIEKSGEFAVSILPQDIDPFIVANFGFQSSRNVDKWANVNKIEKEGLPFIPESLGKIRAKVVNTLRYECNTIFIAEITDAFDYRDAEPLTYRNYHQGFKQQVMTAFSNRQPAPAKETAVQPPVTTAAKEPPQNAEIKEKHWVCTVCGYVYDGDIPFEDLPDDWLCPLCGVGKEFFEQR